eukprot:TRINITY_DN48958_c0_g1_i1.p1 TRINITY_DN48958_c0_g1~~TRINITY_DN48958_c0_g1_i1.p1  ORF type:complete len:340 (-),score=57.51 TRINITY_DN48958_c0_g1_i1:250-1269(-)
MSSMAMSGRYMQGKTYTGMVKSYNRKGFGFIMCAMLEADLYFSRESIHPHLQTSDLAGEHVTFEVRRFSDGKLQAHNLRPVGDVSDFKGGGSRPGKGYGSGSCGKGGREEEDPSWDWHCNQCGERNFAKRLECFSCKKPRHGDGELPSASCSVPPRPAPASRRPLSPHAGSRAVRDTLASQYARKPRSRSARKRSKSRRGRSRSGKRRSGNRSEKKKRRQSSGSSSSATSSGSRKTSTSRSRSRRRGQRSSEDSAAGGAFTSAESLKEMVVTSSPEIDQAKAEVLEKLIAIKELDKEQRLLEWRALLRQWHPDKNPDKTEVATAVFQFLQKGKLLLNST